MKLRELKQNLENLEKNGVSDETEVFFSIKEPSGENLETFTDMKVSKLLLINTMNNPNLPETFISIQ